MASFFISSLTSTAYQFANALDKTRHQLAGLIGYPDDATSTDATSALLSEISTFIDHISYRALAKYAEQIGVKPPAKEEEEIVNQLNRNRFTVQHLVSEVLLGLAHKVEITLSMTWASRTNTGQTVALTVYLTLAMIQQEGGISLAGPHCIGENTSSGPLHLDVGPFPKTLLLKA